MGHDGRPIAEGAGPGGSSAAAKRIRTSGGTAWPRARSLPTRWSACARRRGRRRRRRRPGRPSGPWTRSCGAGSWSRPGSAWASRNGRPRRRRSGRRRVSWRVALPAALAASLILAVLVPWRGPAPLPDYDVRLAGSTRTERSVSGGFVGEGPAVFADGNRFELLLTPRTSAGEDVEARVFVVEGGRMQELAAPPPSRSSDGALRIAGRGGRGRAPAAGRVHAAGRRRAPGSLPDAGRAAGAAGAGRPRPRGPLGGLDAAAARGRVAVRREVALDSFRAGLAAVTWAAAAAPRVTPPRCASSTPAAARCWRAPSASRVRTGRSCCGSRARRRRRRSRGPRAWAPPADVQGGQRHRLELDEGATRLQVEAGRARLDAGHRPAQPARLVGGGGQAPARPAARRGGGAAATDREQRARRRAGPRAGRAGPRDDAARRPRADRRAAAPRGGGPPGAAAASSTTSTTRRC